MNLIFLIIINKIFINLNKNKKKDLIKKFL